MPGLANGDTVPFDRMLIATGVRARPWFNPAEAKLQGVFTLRTCDDAAHLQTALAANPRRVLIVGAGFIGSEIASVCRERGLAVTVAERGSAPLVGALGGVIGRIAAEMQRDHGVDLRTGISIEGLQGERHGLQYCTLSTITLTSSTLQFGFGEMTCESPKQLPPPANARIVPVPAP